jgi:hypothetical protein
MIINDLRRRCCSQLYKEINVIYQRILKTYLTGRTVDI